MWVLTKWHQHASLRVQTLFVHQPSSPNGVNQEMHIGGLILDPFWEQDLIWCSLCIRIANLVSITHVGIPGWRGLLSENQPEELIQVRTYLLLIVCAAPGTILGAEQRSYGKIVSPFKAGSHVHHLI